MNQSINAHRRHAKILLTVLALTGVALDHLVTSLEAGEGHVNDGVLLMVGLLCGDDRRKGGKREMNTREASRMCEPPFNEP